MNGFRKSIVALTGLALTGLALTGLALTGLALTGLALTGLICALVSTPAVADFASGQEAFAAGRHREAFLEWEGDANRGNPVAQFLIANMYAAGEGVDADMEVANSFYEKAAGQGHVESAVKLATNYRLGQGVEDVDLRKASKWLYMAAEAGHPIARFDLGEMFLYGVPERQFYPEPYHASQWFHMASLDGVALARFKLSSLYFAGKGVDKDEVKGFVWLTLANNIATGAEPENKWSKMAMSLEHVIPADKDNGERTFRTVIHETWQEQKASLPKDIIIEAENIVTSGAPEKLR